jgi:hypothetical protein
VARGWESKAVEAQQDAAADRGPASASVIREDPARQAQRMTLTLARTRAQADLARASAVAHRTMLEQAIADLDRQIAALT